MYFRCVVDISGSAVFVFLWEDEGARSAEAVNGGRHVKQTRGRLSLQLFLLRRLSPKKKIALKRRQISSKICFNSRIYANWGFFLHEIVK